MRTTVLLTLFAASQAGSLLNAQPTELRLWTLKNGSSVMLKLENAYGEKAYFTDDQGRSLNAADLAFSEADEAEIVYWSRLRDSGVVNGRLEPGAFTRQFRKDARKRVGDKLVKVDWDNQPEPDFYAVYSSAGVSTPCRQFTPVFVQSYNALKEAHGDRFEVILCGWDETESEMLAYMQDEGMEWYGNWSKRKSKFWAAFQGDSVPCLVVVDRNGYVLSHSYQTGEYVGPEVVLDNLTQLLSWTDTSGGGRMSVPTPGVDKGRLQEAIDQKKQQAMDEDKDLPVDLVLHPTEMLESIADPDAPEQTIKVKVDISEWGVVTSATLVDREDPELRLYLFKTLLLWQFLPAVDRDGSVTTSHAVLPLKIRLAAAPDPTEP